MANDEEPGKVYKIKLLKSERDKNKEWAKPAEADACLLYTSPSPRDRTRSRMTSSA